MVVELEGIFKVDSSVNPERTLIFLSYNVYYFKGISNARRK
jgi:hypothetical protein